MPIAYEDDYDVTMKKVREQVKAALVAQYASAVSPDVVFNNVVDMLVSEAGSFTLLQIVTGLR